MGAKRTMFSCGPEVAILIGHALQCLPDEVVDSVGDRLAFVYMDSDGRRLTREFCADREIIILSERIFPWGWKDKCELKVRYFMFAVLHEVAHAYSDHKAPNSVSIDDNQAQEQQADELAYVWFNDYLRSKNDPPFSSDELTKAKKVSQDEWTKAFGTR